MRAAAYPIEEDMQCQKITWMVERAGWVVMAVIVVATLAGLFGGPTTRRDTHDESRRLLVSYQHYQRHLAPTDMTLTVDTRGQSLFEVTVSRELIDAFEISSVVPQPIETQAHDGGILMKFAASPDNDAPARIAMKGAPSGLGSVNGTVGLIGETSFAHLDIFIYP